MFTGLVEEVGVVEKISKYSNNFINEDTDYRKFRIKAYKILKGLKKGDSVCINGACQTVVNHSGFWSKLLRRGQWFEIESLYITLKKTNFSYLRVGSFVNLESALRISSKLGGHLVSGHIQEVAIVSRIEIIDNNTYLYIQVSKETMVFLTIEGSINIDGISLTIAQIEKNIIMLNIIEHTYENTTIKYLKVNDKVNIEVDILVKYVHNIITPYINQSAKNRTSI